MTKSKISFVDPFEGGEITVAHFVNQAKEVCATANTDQPFMCLDVTYIAVLLKDGYGLNLKTNIKVSVFSIDKKGFRSSNTGDL